MLNNCIGIINITTKSDSFSTLTEARPAFMLPFAGRYRIIDFPLSNLIKHHVARVAVYTGPKVGSVMDHIQTGKPWGLDRRRNGIHIYTPHFKNLDVTNEIKEYYLTLDFYNKSNEDNIIFMTHNKVSQVDLSKAYTAFVESDVDVMFMYTDVENSEYLNESEHIVLDDQNNFVNIGLNVGKNDRINLFNGSFFMKKSAFINTIIDASVVGVEKTLIEAILNRRQSLKISTFKSESYIEDIKNLKNYYAASMNLLESKNFQQLFYEGGQVYTKTKDEPPTFYCPQSKVENSLIANGCVIEGEVINSIIFRGVKVEAGAVIKDSIVMQKTYVKKGALIEKSVLDKAVVIDEDVVIIGTKSDPYIVGKHKTIRKDRR
ncbi:MAG: glucose-1-phosphate adenylyltransferase subunit GlgD [Erysipelothrix sp.]|nr:glucose-1-phosphate adenylyltransferase subunit GlgD [Erysipelothrix sp.]